MKRSPAASKLRKQDSRQFDRGEEVDFHHAPQSILTRLGEGTDRTHPSIVDEEIELAIETGTAEPMLGEHELSSSDLKTLFLDGDELDTTPILMEQLQLNIPMKPLCREDCAGLCPQCGVDRNEVSCSCADSDVAPRWQALEQFRES